MTEASKDGGPAFPGEYVLHPVGQVGNEINIMAQSSGMSLRDWFASGAIEEDLGAYIPKTVGKIADLLVALGWISMRSRQADVTRSYDASHERRLRAWARYRHADAMLAERASRGDRS